MATRAGDWAISYSDAMASFGMVSEWTFAVARNTELKSTLEKLARLVGAGSAMIVKVDRSGHRARIAAICEPSMGQIFPRARRSQARDVFGEVLLSLRPGAVNLASELDSCAELGELSDLAAVVLTHDDATTIVLELQFDRRALAHNVVLLQAMMPGLVAAWRQPQQTQPHAPRRAADAGADLLAPDNPAGLTRSEFRICLLMREGHMPAAIMQELGITRATFRSHMRAVFLKTGTSGQLELTHMLHSAGLPERRLA